MEIQKSKNYIKEYRKKILNLHKQKEVERIEEIEALIIHSANLKELIDNPLRVVYGIEKKQGNMKEIYTAKINEKMRLYMKPVGEYPYNMIEIDIIVFEKIDDKHYGDG